ncbi:MAG: PilZ domain-containing protein, partial [Candidatus Omnitrophica bacterium]|nr:PilZ domain-containing protein [Candidatus Omnitrophota bacterium]
GIPLEQHISPHKRFIIEISLPGREDKIVIKTLVVWCRRNKFHWQALFGAGLQFEKIDPELVEKLLQFARTHQWQKSHFEERLENREIPILGQA